MTLSLPDALRAMQWLLTPWHLLAVYAFEVVELAFALLGMITAAWLAVRRYGAALATLALAVQLATFGPDRSRRAHAATRRPGFAQRRVVHPVHPARQRPAAPASAPTQAAEAPRPAAVTAPPRTVEAEPERNAEQQRATRHLPHRHGDLSEGELLTLANDVVIGPLIDACRQAAEGSR